MATFVSFTLIRFLYPRRTYATISFFSLHPKPQEGQIIGAAVALGSVVRAVTCAKVAPWQTSELRLLCLLRTGLSRRLPGDGAQR